MYVYENASTNLLLQSEKNKMKNYIIEMIPIMWYWYVLKEITILKNSKVKNHIQV